jgi:drug/metabolite transporter (DMT)-like permease
LATAVIGIPFLFLPSNAITGTAVLYVVILGVFQLGIPYVLYGLAAGKCPPLAVCLVGILEPLLNPIWVFLFNGELPGVWAFVGGGLVSVSVTAWCVWDARRGRKAGV